LFFYFSYSVPKEKGEKEKHIEKMASQALRLITSGGKKLSSCLDKFYSSFNATCAEEGTTVIGS
jgi:hypothetical protein